MNRRISKAFGALFLALELAIVPKAIDLMLSQRLSALSPVQIVVLAMTFGSIALCILMSFSSLSEADDYPRHVFLFELMVFLCCVSSVTDFMTKALDSTGRSGLNMLVNTVYYLVGVNLAYGIMRYEFLVIGFDDKPKLKRIRDLLSLLAIAGSAATLLNARFGYFFTITADGTYQSAPTYWLSYIAPAVIVLVTAAAAAREMRPGRQRRAFLYFWAFALLASALQAWRPELSFQYTGYTLSLIVLYVNIQSELDVACVNIRDSEASQHESVYGNG